MAKKIDRTGPEQIKIAILLVLADGKEHTTDDFCTGAFANPLFVKNNTLPYCIKKYNEYIAQAPDLDDRIKIIYADQKSTLSRVLKNLISRKMITSPDQRAYPIKYRLVSKTLPDVIGMIGVNGFLLTELVNSEVFKNFVMGARLWAEVSIHVRTMEEGIDERTEEEDKKVGDELDAFEEEYGVKIRGFGFSEVGSDMSSGGYAELCMERLFQMLEMSPRVMRYFFNAYNRNVEVPGSYRFDWIAMYRTCKILFVMDLASFYVINLGKFAPLDEMVLDLSIEMGHLDPTEVAPGVIDPTRGFLVLPEVEGDFPNQTAYRCLLDAIAFETEYKFNRDADPSTKFEPVEGQPVNDTSPLDNGAT
jgi:hypothetical protein